MIRISIERNQHNQFLRVSIQGHANYAEHGKDIVCAAVSGISIGMINAIEKLLSIRVVSQVSELGELDCRIPEIPDKALMSKVQLLIEAMVIALSNVADEYPQYIQIKQTTKG